MNDARIIVDELVIDCLNHCAEAAARQLGGAVARALGAQLQQFQSERLEQCRRGDAVPRAIHLERVIVRLESAQMSPNAIARTLRDAIETARRRAHE